MVFTTEQLFSDESFTVTSWNTSVNGSEDITLPFTPSLECTPGERVEHSNLETDILKHFDAIIPEPYPTWDIALKIVAYAIAIPLGIVGNTAVLVVLIFNKNMRTTTNVYIANLAVSDLLVCCICMWIHLGAKISITWPFGPFLCRINTFFQGWMPMASIFVLLVISCDRFFAIIYPLKARMTPTRCVIVVALVWIVSASISAPNLFFTTMYEVEYRNWKEVWCEEAWPRYWYIAEREDGTQYCSAHAPGRKVYIIFTVIILYFVPVVVMAVTYSIIVYKLWTRTVPGEQSYNTLYVQQKSRRKVVRMLVVVLLAFVICWTPLHSLRLYDEFRSQEVHPDWVEENLKFAITYLAYFNSAINPILYGGLNENFKKGFRQVFKCKLCKRNHITPYDNVTANDGTLVYRNTRITLLKLKMGFKLNATASKKCIASQHKYDTSGKDNELKAATKSIKKNATKKKEDERSINTLKSQNEENSVTPNQLKYCTESENPMQAVLQVEDIDSICNMASGAP